MKVGNFGLDGFALGAVGHGVELFGGSGLREAEFVVSAFDGHEECVAFFVELE